MYKLLPVIFTLLAFSLSAFAQQNSCGQAEVAEQLFKARPELRQQFLESQKAIPTLSKEQKLPTSVTSEPAFMIPVVFHVLHQGGVENISEAQINDQIRILNRDYQKKNADTANIVSAFQNNIANVGFGFKLARIDPDGRCTNGIVRHFTSKTNWDANNLGDFIYSWPRNKYLNIYVVKTLNITATAYAFLPGTPVAAGADVIVTIHQMVGSIGTGNGANSRVLTHEVGHWFGLQHIWGTSNTPGVVCGDDLVTDTPETKGFATCAISNTGICNPGIPENVQNYMDYSPCKIMFTNGQKDRMLGLATGALNGRNNVTSPNNLLATGIANSTYVCSPSVDFKVSSLKKCTNKSLTFTSLTQSGVSPGTRLWTFPGGNPASSTDSIAVVTYSTPGVYSVTLQVTNSVETVTDFRESYITIVDGSQGEVAPYSIDFEIDSLVSKLVVVNPDESSNGWIKNSTFGANGSGKCFMLNSFNDFLEIKGEKDAFELPPLNLTGQNEITISYYYAYARPLATQKDSFKVQYSLDCGGNWTNITGLPTTNQMAVASGGTTENEFFPSASQWIQTTIPSTRLTPLAQQNGVKIRFLFVKDINKTYTNNLFIDQINVSGTTTQSEGFLAGSEIVVFPNPSDGSFTVQTGGESKSKIEARLFDIQGKELHEVVRKGHDGDIVVNSDNMLTKGVYMLMLNLNGQMLPQKLVVN